MTRKSEAISKKLNTKEFDKHSQTQKMKNLQDKIQELFLHFIFFLHIIALQ